MERALNQTCAVEQVLAATTEQWQTQLAQMAPACIKPEPTSIALTIGTLSAAKLVFRRTGDGSLNWRLGYPLDEYYEKLLDTPPHAPLESWRHVFPGVSPHAPVRLLRQPDPALFRWTPAARPTLEPSWDDEALNRLKVPVRKLSRSIVEYALGRLNREAAAYDEDFVALERIHQFVAFAALIRWLLFVWGNGQLAAELESLADRMSANEYAASACGTMRWPLSSPPSLSLAC